MAFFAQLDTNNKVINVVVVNDKKALDLSGAHSENIGIAFCQMLAGADTVWKETFKSGGQRKRFASVGYTYDQVLDAFITPRPYASWTLDSSTADWVSPAGPAPVLTEEQVASGCFYSWRETAACWVLSRI